MNHFWYAELSSPRTSSKIFVRQAGLKIELLSHFLPLCHPSLNSSLRKKMKTREKLFGKFVLVFLDNMKLRSNQFVRNFFNLYNTHLLVCLIAFFSVSCYLFFLKLFFPWFYKMKIFDPYTKNLVKITNLAFISTKIQNLEYKNKCFLFI